jgi:hypothetical protein
MSVLVNDDGTITTIVDIVDHETKGFLTQDGFVYEESVIGKVITGPSWEAVYQFSIPSGGVFKFYKGKNRMYYWNPQKHGSFHICPPYLPYWLWLSHWKPERLSNGYQLEDLEIAMKNHPELFSLNNFNILQTHRLPKGREERGN